MSDDVSPGSGRSKRRKSRLGRKEYPIGKPVAPPPGWVPPVAPAPPPPPMAMWQAPVVQAPLAPPLASWAAPIAEPSAEAPVAELAPSGEPTSRPVMLSPNSAPIWTPLPREAEPSPDMTYNLTEPPARPVPVSYGTEPDLLTPASKIGLALIGVFLLVGAGLFVFNDGWRTVKSIGNAPAVDAEPAPIEPSVAIASITPPPVAPPAVTRVAEPVVEKKAPEPEKTPVATVVEPKVETKPLPDRPEKPPTDKKPVAPPVNPFRAALVFENDVFPIFKAKCIACHGGRKKGGVDIRSVDALVGKGEEDGVLVRRLDHQEPPLAGDRFRQDAEGRPEAHGRREGTDPPLDHGRGEVNAEGAAAALPDVPNQPGEPGPSATGAKRP